MIIASDLIERWKLVRERFDALDAVEFRDIDRHQIDRHASLASLPTAPLTADERRDVEQAIDLADHALDRLVRRCGVISGMVLGRMMPVGEAN